MRIKIISSDVFSILSQRGWQACAGFVTLVFVARCLTPVEQGWYYTFASLAAIQIIFDMGLSTVLIQVAAHEFSGLCWGIAGTVKGPGKERFLALLRKAVSWYFCAAACFLITIPIGLFFFSSTADEIGYNWRWAWGLVVLATGGNLMVLPVLSIIEGTGKVREAYSVRLIQGMAGAAAIWTILNLKGGLYAAAAMPGISMLIGCLWLSIYKRKLIIEAFRVSGRHFSWLDEVWPFQWRMGVSWLCSYLLMQIHTPLLFRTQGAVVAGQMGLSISITNMLGLLSQAWMTSRIPGMAKAVSMKDWKTLDVLFIRGSISVLTVFAASACLAMILRWGLTFSPYDNRILPLGEFGGLLFVVLLSQATGMIASQLRAFRKEPFMTPSIIGAALTVGGAVWAAPRFSAMGIIVVMIMVNGGFGLPVSIWLWKRCNFAWRQAISD